MSRGDLQKRILETFVDLALFPIDSVEVLLSAGYNPKLSRLEYERTKISRRRSNRRFENTEQFNKFRRLQIYVSKLKNQGLLCESKEKDGKLILSKTGQEKLMELTFQAKYRNYKKEKINHTLIVAFDIPENERGKRDWLRDVLKELGFKMIQRSFWVGDIKFPQELLTDLERLNMLDFVQVLAVTKSGTLKNIAQNTQNKK